MSLESGEAKGGAAVWRLTPSGFIVIPTVLIDADGNIGLPDSSNTIGKVKVTNGTNDADVNSDNQLSVILEGTVDNGNSSTDTLGAGISFTGEGVNTLRYGVIFVTVFSDKASAVDGFMTQISSDGVTWRDGDSYTIAANTEKTYAFQPNKKWFRIKYTNGGSIQTVFDLQTVMKGTNSKPTSHRIGDDISPEDDVELTKSAITFATNTAGNLTNVGVQTPLPTDGDSLYKKDICDGASDVGTFSTTTLGLLSLFDSLDTTIESTGATNPKYFEVELERPITTSEVALNTITGNFSNVKIVLKDRAGNTILTVDDSANNTDYTANAYPFSPTNFCCLRVEFHTADDVTLGFVRVKKDVAVEARLRALKPDGTITDIDATVGGNLKVSIEELESGISINGNTQLRTTLLDEAGRIQEFDNKFKVPIFINVEHHEVHEGCSFERHISSVNLAVTTLNVAFKTLAGTKLAHMLFGFASNDEIHFEVIEGATWNQGSGTALNIFNENRNNGSNSTVILEDKNQAQFTASNQVIKDVVNVAGGTSIEPDRYTYNAGLGAATVAETREAGHEWILKNDTTYVIRITQTDGDCKMSIDLHWYEHLDE